MNHYEVLGIDKSATQEAVRVAFRHKASRHHPDRGGDPSMMAAVNRAWECLGDVQRRREYDESGQDSSGPSVREVALQTIAVLFSKVLDAGITSGLLASICALQRSESDRLRERLGALEKQRRLLGESSKRVHAKAGCENLLGDLVALRLRELSAAISETRRLIEVADCVDGILSQHEEDEDQSILHSYFVGGTAAPTSFVWGGA